MSPRDSRVEEEETYSNSELEETNMGTGINEIDEDSEDEIPGLISMMEVTQMWEAETRTEQHAINNNQEELHNNNNHILLNNNNATNDTQNNNESARDRYNSHNHNNMQTNNGHNTLRQGDSISPATWREQQTMYQRIIATPQDDKINTVNQYSISQQMYNLEKQLIHLKQDEADKHTSDNKVTIRKPKSLRNPTKHLKKPIHNKRSKVHQQKIDELHDLVESSNVEEALRKPWGHPLRIQDNWPSNNDNNTLRVATVNINGISPNNNYLEMEAIVGQMIEQQIDILCLTEINLDFNKKEIYNNIWETLKKVDRHIDINMRTSTQPSRITNSTFKPGGTMILTSSAWSGRRIREFKEPKTKDIFGRWTTTHLRCKSGKAITIINWYRVNNDKNNLGATNTIYMQQTNQLEKHYNRTMDPRKTITKDMKNYIRDLIARGHHVLLVGDTNEHLQNAKNEIQTMLDELEMKNISIQQHPNTTLPSTYDRGPNCLDLLAGSNNIIEKVQATGFMPFYIPFCTDHRLGFVDLDTNKLFGRIKKDTTKEIFHGFHTKNVYKCNEYLTELEEQFERHKIFQKVAEIKQRVVIHLNSTKTPTNEKQQLITEICKLENIRSELMFGSEAKCRKQKYKHKFPYSGKLVQAAKLLWITKTLLRQIRLGKIHSTEAETMEANKLQKRALKNLRSAQQSSIQFREEMLDKLAVKLSQQWKVDHSSAIIIRNAEAIQLLFSRVSRAMKPGRTGTIQYVLQPNIPNPDEKNDKHWEVVDQQESLNTAIIHQNSKHLLKSTNAITARGSLRQSLGWQAENEDTVQSILEGNMTVQETEHPEAEIQQFMESLKAPKVEGDDKNEMSWSFGIKEYKALFGKTRESTACGPSGLHMSHWKAAVEKDNIAEVHAFFIWAAFSLGFSYHRWQVSWHCMLQKRKQPYIHRLRIIQLFEGDFNGGLKYLLGKKLMQHMVTNGLIPNETFGSIPGRNAAETMKLLQLFYENHRILKKDMAIVFNDADGCYDRIRPNMVDITMRRLGLPRSIAAAHTDAQVKMRHHIKTANGISPEILQWAPTPNDTIQCMKHNGIKRYTGNIGGLGQGGGGGPVGWLSILIVLLDAYHSLATSATLTDPIGLLSFSIYVLSYVDDNSLITSLPTTMPMHKIVELVQKNFEHWKHLLQITGGDLSLGKCTFSLMKWNHKKQQLHTMETMQGDITIDDIKIRRIEVDKAERQLGIRVSLDGNFQDEYTYRLERANELGRRISNSSLTTIGAHMAYSLYYKPMIQYPLSVTTFSDTECDKIHSKFVFRCLPKMGINRHMPRVVVFGPMKYGGMNLFDLKLEQLHQHLRTTKAHMRRQDQVGKGIISNINALQLISGSANNILLQDPNDFQYIHSNTSLEYLWKASFQYNFKIHYNINLPQAKFIHDINIMDYARTKAYTTNQLASINICRLYYKAIYLGDLTDHTGKYINRQYITNGLGIPTRNNTIIQSPNPEHWRWKIWNGFILKQFTRGDMSIIPKLGILNTHNTHNSHNFEVGPYTNHSFRTIRDATSDILQKFGGNLEIPPNEGAKMITAIMTTQLEGASDGSWKETEGIGTWGYALAIFDPLRPLAEHTELVQRGSGNCMLHDATNAQTAEHYGAIAVLVFLYILALTHQLTEEECKDKYVVIWIDNAEVQKRFNETPTFTKVGTYVNADVELWTTIHILKQKIPFTVVSRWVKGHQDRHTKFSELSFNAQLNILADEAAEKQYHKEDTYNNTAHLHQGGGSILSR